MDHVIEAAAPAKYKHINFKPPEGVRKAAKRGLEMRKEHGRGGTAVGVARARDLMNGKQISPSTARRMKAYFDRHQPDQKAEGFDSGEDGYPSAGRVAWELWGGDAGYSWAKKLVKQMNSADGKVSASATTRTYYHGGAKRYSRLLPSKNGVFGAGIYLTTDKKAAERYARSAPGAENGGAVTEVTVTVDPEKVWSSDRKYDLRDFTDAPWLADLIEKYGEGAAIKDGMNAAVYLFGNDTSKIKDLGYQAFQTRSASPTDHDLLVLDDSIISYSDDVGSQEQINASNCGCAESCECGCQAPGGGQPPSDMTISNLKQIIRDAEAIMAVLHEDMEIMGWAEDKVSQAKAGINSVRNYIENDFVDRSVHAFRDSSYDFGDDFSDFSCDECDSWERQWTLTRHTKHDVHCMSCGKPMLAKDVMAGECRSCYKEIEGSYTTLESQTQAPILLANADRRSVAAALLAAADALSKVEQ